LKFSGNKVVNNSTIRKVLQNYYSSFILRVIKIHEFRHSCATYLVKKI